MLVGEMWGKGFVCFERPFKGAGGSIAGCGAVG